MQAQEARSRGQADIWCYDLGIIDKTQNLNDIYLIKISRKVTFFHYMENNVSEKKSHWCGLWRGYKINNEIEAGELLYVVLTT